MRSMHVYVALAVTFSTAVLTIQGSTTASSDELAARTRSVAGDGSRPNVVLITADDMRADDLRFMPHTRRLVGRAGVTFTDAISNYPLCCPARATLLTGQYPHNHGVRGNEYPFGGHKKFHVSGAEENTLPMWLSASGYRTSLVGKYLNYYGSPQDRQAAVPRTYVPPGWDDWHAAVGEVFRYYCPTLNNNGDIRRYRGEYQTDLYTRLARQAIHTAAERREPLFLWVSHLAPHAGRSPAPSDACSAGEGLPTPAAERHRGMFAGVPLPTTPATNEADLTDKGPYLRDKEPTDLDHQADVHQGRVEALQALDESVADTVAALRATGELANTVLLFTSDNGWLQGEHRLAKKTWPYEESLAVPLLARGPGFPAGQTRNQPVGLVDIPATALDIAEALPEVEGQPVPQDGTSLIDLAADETYLADRVMPIEAGPARGVQRKVVRPLPDWFYRGAQGPRYTYIGWDMGGGNPSEEELYDRAADPHQLDGEADEGSRVLQAMRAVSAELEDCAGPSCVTELPVRIAEAGAVAESGRPSDGAAPGIRVLDRPAGWIRTTKPLLKVVIDPDDNVQRPLRVWCSQRATGCDRAGKVRFRLPGQGAHYWSIFAGDAALEGLASRVGRVKVDLRRPRVERIQPRHAVLLGPTRLRWEASDRLSGVADVHLRRRTAALSGSFGPWKYPTTRQGEETVRVDVSGPKRAGTVCLEVRARDVAGWRSAWGAQMCRARALDAASLGGDRWRDVRRERWYGGTATIAKAAGSALTVDSRGPVAHLSLRTQLSPTAGRVELSVGRTRVARLDLRAPERRLATIKVPVRAGLEGAATVRVLSDGQPVAIDAVGVVRRPPR